MKVSGARGRGLLYELTEGLGGVRAQVKCVRNLNGHSIAPYQVSPRSPDATIEVAATVSSLFGATLAERLLIEGAGE